MKIQFNSTPLVPYPSSLHNDPVFGEKLEDEKFEGNITIPTACNRTFGAINALTKEQKYNSKLFFKKSFFLKD